MVLACAALTLLVATDITPAEALVIANRFREVAAKACGPNFLGVFAAGDLTLEPDAGLPENEWSFSWPSGLIGVNKRTGRVRVFMEDVHDGFPENWNERDAMTDTALLNLTKQYMVAAGNLQPKIGLRAKQAEPGYQLSASMWSIACPQKFSQDVEYYIDYDVGAVMEHVTGRLKAIWIPELPPPPADMRVTISSDQALATASLFIGQYANVSVLQIFQPMRKVIWVPNPANLERNANFLSEADVLLGQQGKTKLIYWVYFSVRESPFQGYWVYVDPVTGVVLGAANIWTFGGSPVSVKPSVASWLKGDLTVTVGKRQVKVKGASLSPCYPPKLAGTTRHVVLTKGARIAIALFDVNNKVVMIDRRWFKPNPKLLAALGLPKSFPAAK